MSDLTAADFGDLIAGRIRAEHLSISARWLERLRELLPVDVNEVFPTEELLDHIPALILEVAGYIHSPETEAVASITSITAKATGARDASAHAAGVGASAAVRNIGSSAES